jgi:hypothetical protein
MSFQSCEIRISLHTIAVVEKREYMPEGRQYTLKIVDTHRYSFCPVQGGTKEACQAAIKSIRQHGALNWHKGMM